MDIKKPGPVKAHSFLKLKLVCKKLQSINRQSHRDENKNNNVKFAGDWLGRKHAFLFYTLIILCPDWLIRSSHFLIMYLTFLLPCSITHGITLKGNLRFQFLAPAPSHQQSRSDGCWETGRCSQWPFLSPTHAYADAALLWRWHCHWAWHHNSCAWCINAAL